MSRYLPKLFAWIQSWAVKDATPYVMSIVAAR